MYFVSDCLNLSHSFPVLQFSWVAFDCFCYDDNVIKSNPGELKDRETMRKIQAIANEVHESIKVTIDFPSKHANNVILISSLIVAAPNSYMHGKIHSQFSCRIKKCRNGGQREA